MARITLRPLQSGDVAIVRRLLHLYLYDLGGERWDVETDGAYGPPGWHRRFWRRRGSHHLIVMRIDETRSAGVDSGLDNMD